MNSTPAELTTATGGEDHAELRHLARDQTWPVNGSTTWSLNRPYSRGPAGGVDTTPEDVKVTTTPGDYDRQAV